MINEVTTSMIEGTMLRSLTKTVNALMPPSIINAPKIRKISAARFFSFIPVSCGLLWGFIGLSSLKLPQKICNPICHQIFVTTNHSIGAPNQHTLTCKRKDHPICPRLGEPNDIAAKQTRANKLPHKQPGKPSVLSLFCHSVARWPN